MYDLIIRGGTIYDGLGGAPFTGDIAISGDTIAAVGKVTGGARGNRCQRPYRYPRLCRYPHPL